MIIYVVTHDGGFLYIFAAIAFTVPFAILFGYCVGLREGKEQRKFILLKTIELYFEIKYETDVSFKVLDGETEGWLPKSQVQVTQRTETGAVFNIPEFLARQKGFI